jgi:hypothetical protein
MASSTSLKQIFSKCRFLGSGARRIILSESELFALMSIVVQDLGWKPGELDLPELNETMPGENYYQIPFQWFDSHEGIAPTSQILIEALAKGVSKHNDFSLYFQNLCELHKRRTKYQNILSLQPRPTMDQVGPRSLLEYGICDSQFLSSWMIWRKWIFDIDNRSAQETGYLFEPILASCLGGETIGARNSPVKRLDQAGNLTTAGRQIDCYVGEDNLAYEFKLRVTIAASGQGRFPEELSFPQECAAAGLTPVLLVLDPTPSFRLDNLEKAFIDVGGRSFIGDDAWLHMEDKAGDVMSIFLEKYIRPPLAEMAAKENLPLANINLRWSENEIVIEGGTEKYIIPR